MQRFQAFKYELMPSGDQQRRMRRFAGSGRYVYNRALALQKERFEQGEKRLGYVELARQLTAWRNAVETSWLKDSPCQPLQQALMDLERAYTNFFAKRAAFPRFKKKGRRESFRYPDRKALKRDQDNGRIYLPKLGWMRYRNSRPVLGEVRNATVLLASLLITLVARGYSYPDYKKLVLPSLVTPLQALRTWAFTFTFLSIGLTTRIREIAAVGAKPFYAFTAGVVVNVILGFVLSTQVFVDFWTRLGQ